MNKRRNGGANDRVEALAKRRKEESDEDIGVRALVNRILPSDLANIVLGYAPKFWLREIGEARDRARFWAHQLRWWVRYFQMYAEDVVLPEFVDFGLHDLHKGEFDQYILPILKRTEWPALTYWELRRVIIQESCDPSPRRSRL